MLKYSVPLVGLLLISCSSQEPRGACGVSFCLPASAKLLSKRSPVEDFYLYDLEWRGERFGIYEGNHPQKGTGEPIALRLPIDQTASLRAANGKGNVIISMLERWPAYLEVSGPCPSFEQCPVKELAAELSLP